IEMESELPTDDASIEFDHEGSRGDAKPSESLLTLKRSWSQETLTASSDLCLDAIHLDFLVEKGLIDYNSLDQQAGDETGDYSRRLTSASDRGRIAEIVNEMRNEFIGKLSSNVKGLKKNLIKVGTSTISSDPDGVDHRNELVPKNLSKVELEVPKFMTDKKSLKEELSTEDGNRDDDDIILLISEINEFTSEVERDPDNVDWSRFRANLLKIHRHYVQSPGTRAHYQSEVPSSDIRLPVDDLKSQAKYLRRKVQGLESKILSLDQTLEVFSENFSRSLVSKSSVDHEMMAISIMRNRISQRLSELENEFHRARKQLF
ncbi:hypothetical protein KR032_006494, partial [Drosophila birchii]